MPRKSRMRGMAMEMRRSKNSHMRSPRRVTLAPIGMPARSLKVAMDLRAWVISGCWPVMARRSATAPSMALASVAASPTPMLTTIFSILGIWLTFL